MHPRHCVDEFVIVEDGEKASVGDDVIVVMIDGTTITWRLDAVSDTEITVHGYNPPLTTTIQRRLIREIHPILWAVKGIYDTTTGTVL
jgi:phage repressor protein C with HTH and peptisase S24 domain